MINRKTLSQGYIPILLIVLLGLFLRLLFIFFGASLYYGNENFWIGGDSFTWINSIINLIDKGTYSVDLKSEIGYFFRPPGYSFFIGFFYLLSDKNLEIAYQLIIWTQIILDVFAIFLIFKISCFTFNNFRIALITASLYAAYPFIIVWTPIIYAESTSVFFLILSLYFFFHPNIKYKYVFSGLFLSISVLTRIQIIFLFPILTLAIILIYWKQHKKMLIHLLQYSVIILIVYGAWPLRNYINYNKIVFAQEIEGIGHWSSDYTSFYEYMWSVQTDEEPQHSQILNGEKVIFPDASYKIKGDSTKLAKVIELCRACGEGFSYWMRSAGLIDEIIEKNNCNGEIVKIFNELESNQRKYNSLHYYLIVPLQNLKKAIFKFKLNKPISGIVGKISMLIFSYRIILIVMGLMGIFLLLKNKLNASLNLIILLYFITWYFFDCFIFRSMEIRYFLPADVLLLIPGSYFICFSYNRLSSFYRTQVNRKSVPLNFL